MDKATLFAAQSKGGRVRTPGKKHAQQIRRLKEKGVTDASAREMLRLMEDSSASALDILRLTKELTKNEDMDFRKKSIVIDTLAKWHKLHHGDKTMVSSTTNTQINIITDSDVDEILDRLAKK